jgi:hypothetical protein
MLHSGNFRCRDAPDALQFGEASGEFPAGFETFDGRRLAPPRGEQAGVVAFVSVNCLHDGFLQGSGVSQGLPAVQWTNQASVHAGGKEMSPADPPSKSNKLQIMPGPVRSDEFDVAHGHAVDVE